MSVVMKQPAQVAATTTSALLVAENQSRSFLRVKNRGTDAVLIKPDGAHSGTEGMHLASGESWEPRNVPVNALYVRTLTLTATVDVTEG